MTNVNIEKEEHIVKILEALKSESFIILDGAVGTELKKYGMKAGETSEQMNISHPDWVIDIASKYAKAGSMVIAANTFGINRIKLAETGKNVEEEIIRAVSIARRAVSQTNAAVSLDIGPIGQLLEPNGYYHLKKRMMFTMRWSKLV